VTEVFQVSDTGVPTLELLSDVGKMISRDWHRVSQLNFCRHNTWLCEALMCDFDAC